MTVKVVLWDGTTIEPTYDPAHREAIVEFYNNQVNNMQISNWTIIQ